MVAVIWVGVSLAPKTAAHSSLFPTPKEVITSFITLFHNGLIGALVTSYTANLTALAWTLAISLPLSYVAVIPLFRPISTLTSKLRFLGFTGLPFFLTLVLASGHAVKIAMLVFGMSVFFVTSMVEVVESIPREKLDHACTLGLNDWQVLWHVVILGTRDQAIEVLRQQAAMGFMLLTMVEGIARADGGVGVMLLNENKYLHLSSVLAIQIVILTVGLLQDFLIGWMKDVICPYAALKVER